MEALLRSLNQHISEVLLIVLVVSLGIAFALAAFIQRFNRNADRWRDLMKSPTGTNLEEVLADHLEERRRLDQQVRSLLIRVERLETELTSSKRHLGLVKYDAFEEVSGKQSFALAVYDDQGNGAVLSGIVGRTDCRVYCKPIVNGRSERNLSQEERRAIDEATATGVRSIVSP